MSESYPYTRTSLTSFTKAKTASPNAEFLAIQQAFACLPTLAMLRGGTTNFAEDAGSADAYVVTRTFAATAYADGMKVRMKVGAGNTNTGACTVDVDAIGARSIKLITGDDPAAADLTAGDFIELVYDADNTRFLITSVVRSMFA